VKFIGLGWSGVALCFFELGDGALRCRRTSQRTLQPWSGPGKGSQGARWGGGRGVALRFFEPSDELHGVRGLARGHCSLGADRAGGNCGPARGGRWGDG
jgi:hypothetical protein